MCWRTGDTYTETREILMKSRGYNRARHSVSPSTHLVSLVKEDSPRKHLPVGRERDYVLGVGGTERGETHVTVRYPERRK